MSASSTTEQATLAGGCFWCLEPLFAALRGVQDVVVGYTGGEMKSPSYAQVCSGRTGHAEAIQVTFDPAQISYADILRVFFSIHDPTTPDRQGADVGTQYRSAIFTHSEQQNANAGEVVRELTEAHMWPRPIVTEIAPFTTFYPAEEYHQEYYTKNPGAGYCQVVIAPKVAKFRKQFARELQPGAII